MKIPLTVAGIEPATFRFVARHDLYCSTYSWCVGHVARVGRKKNAYVILVRRPTGKKPLGRPKYRWENIKMVGRPWPDQNRVAQDRSHCVCV